MAFRIEITSDAEAHLRGLPVREQRILEVAVLARLQHVPTQPTRAIKRLIPNPFADFELRVGNLRVLYNVEGQEVIILAVGKKAGNKLIVAGVEFYEHQEPPTEPTGSGSAGDLE